MASVCRTCKAPIIWALTDKGKRMPLDAEPVPAGNIEIVDRTEHDEEGNPIIRARVLKKGEGDTLPGLTVPDRYVSHFSTCQFAADHRTGR